MCVVSMIGDHYSDKWKKIFPEPFPAFYPAPPTREEFDQLKREVLELRELLKKAKAYDEANGEPNCEMEEKMDLLRKVAKLVGVELNI